MLPMLFGTPSVVLAVAVVVARETPSVKHAQGKCPHSARVGGRGATQERYCLGTALSRFSHHSLMKRHALFLAASMSLAFGFSFL